VEKLQRVIGLNFPFSVVPTEPAAYDGGNSEKYPIMEQARLFTLSEGVLQAWGKLLDLHGVEEEYHVRARQTDLAALIKESDRVVSL